MFYVHSICSFPVSKDVSLFLCIHRDYTPGKIDEQGTSLWDKKISRALCDISIWLLWEWIVIKDPVFFADFMTFPDKRRCKQSFVVSSIDTSLTYEWIKWRVDYIRFPSSSWRSITLRPGAGEVEWLLTTGWPQDPSAAAARSSKWSSDKLLFWSRVTSKEADRRSTVFVIIVVDNDFFTKSISIEFIKNKNREIHFNWKPVLFYFKQLFPNLL